MSDAPAPIKTRITEITGADYPIVQAPMGWIARSQLCAAVSSAGGIGILETSSGEFDRMREEVRRMRELTDKPFGMNLALAFVPKGEALDFVIEQQLDFVTTSSGSPKLCTETLQRAGIKVFHVVPTLEMALKALDAGVDGLVVEGGEGGGFKNPDPVSTMVLLPLIRSHTDVPIIAAGGITDGATMAAAFMLGADGVQMGTRMMSSTESPIHQNWKQAVIEAGDTGTVFLNQQSRPALRALRTERTMNLYETGPFNFMEHMAGHDALYFGGDMEAAIPLAGQVCGRINSVRPVRDIIYETVNDFRRIIGEHAARYVG